MLSAFQFCVVYVSDRDRSLSHLMLQFIDTHTHTQKKKKKKDELKKIFHAECQWESLCELFDRRGKSGY